MWQSFECVGASRTYCMLDQRYDPRSAGAAVRFKKKKIIKTCATGILRQGDSMYS